MVKRKPWDNIINYPMQKKRLCGLGLTNVKWHLRGSFVGMDKGPSSLRRKESSQEPMEGTVTFWKGVEVKPEIHKARFPEMKGKVSLILCRPQIRNPIDQNLVAWWELAEHNAVQTLPKVYVQKWNTPSELDCLQFYYAVFYYGIRTKRSHVSSWQGISNLAAGRGYLTSQGQKNTSPRKVPGEKLC